MDEMTLNYRTRELEMLNLSPCEYKPSIQIFDGKGNKTKFLNLEPDELKQIIRLLMARG